MVEYFGNDKKKSTAVQTQENFYDAENLRYGVVENGERTNFITNGWEVLVEQDESCQTTNRIVLGYGIIASDSLKEDGDAYRYFHWNEHGDTEYITGEYGQVLNHYGYDAFGSLTRADEIVRNRYTYNGEQYDAITSQYYLRARFYNPQVARFTQEDVYRGDGLNLYAYCANNPVMYIDPSGYAKADNDIKFSETDNTFFNSNYSVLGKTHTKVEAAGTVFVKGKARTIDRTVYQLDGINWDYVSSSKQNPDGLSNRQLAKLGRVPFGSDDMWIELHHLIQNEPGSMIELMGSKHDKYSKQLHGMVQKGESFRNNEILDAQYDKFRKEYWKQRIKEVEFQEAKKNKCSI